MLLLTPSEIDTRLHAYEWEKLWHQVKHINPILLTKDQLSDVYTQRAIAFKAMFLMNDWHLVDEAIVLCNLLPEKTIDDYVDFARIYTYIVLAKREKVLHYRQFLSPNAPLWMRLWLDIEFHGRSLAFKEQVRVLKRIEKDHVVFPAYAMIALMQTLSHPQAELNQLLKFIEKTTLKIEASPLGNAFLLFLNKTKAPSVVGQPNSSQLLQNARQLVSELKLQEAQRFYDAYVQQGALNRFVVTQWLHLGLCSPWGLTAFESRAKHAIEQAPDYINIIGGVASRLLVYYWITRNYAKAFQTVQQYVAFKDVPRTKENKITQIFFDYTLKLCVAWEIQNDKYRPNANAKPLHVLGESHSLSPSNRLFDVQGTLYHAQAHIVWGLKMFHLRADNSVVYRALFDDWLLAIPKDEALLITVGEIDLRPDEGVWKNSYMKGKAVKDVLEETILQYIDYLKQVFAQRTAVTLIQGIPAPAYPLSIEQCGSPAAFLAMIEQANQFLKSKTIEYGWTFVDVYTATCNAETKFSNMRYHLDQNHLAPRFYDEINQYLIK